jgi:hypothetical protein
MLFGTFLLDRQTLGQDFCQSAPTERGHVSNKSIGKLPSRYSFILNPYKNVRLSKCPRCQKPTHMRKFALLIHVDEWGLLALGKTCRYCTRCELIIAHKDELEDELVGVFERHAPEVIGKP